jgi:hypothetical protein
VTTLTDELIGQLVRRSGRASSVWHHLDSVVAGDAVTRCGKRMADRPTAAGELQVATERAALWELAAHRCRSCFRGR